jgi:hypothetical protein
VIKDAGHAHVNAVTPSRDGALYSDWLHGGTDRQLELITGQTVPSALRAILELVEMVIHVSDLEYTSNLNVAVSPLKPSGYCMYRQV